MLEGNVKKIQGEIILIETKQGNLTLPVSAFDYLPQVDEKVFVSVSKEDMAKKVINELLSD